MSATMSRRPERSAYTIGNYYWHEVVSRGDLISWVNDLLQVNLTKVEQCASGSIYCQIIDACHPNTVAMRNVNWVAKLDHEFIANYKVLQAAFDKNSIKRFIDVDKLIRGMYQDNLEFLQFIKRYWDRSACRNDYNYDPCHAREGKALPAWCYSARARWEMENVTPKAATVKPGPTPEKPLGSTGQPAAALGATVKATGGLNTPRSHNNSFVSDGSVALDTSATRGRVSADLGLQAENKRLEEENQEFRAKLDGLGKERDDYSRKLRSLEMFCTRQAAQEDPTTTSEKVLNDITGILYAQGSDEDEPEEQATEEASFMDEFQVKFAETSQGDEDQPLAEDRAKQRLRKENSAVAEPKAKSALRAPGWISRKNNALRVSDDTKQARTALQEITTEIS